MKLSDYAKEHEIQYRTAWNRFKKGLIPNAYKDKFGLIRIKEEDIIVNKKIATYSRVSSSENKSNLTSQSLRIQNYATAKGYQISKVVEEVGSGMNDKRPKLISLLKDKEIDLIIIEHKDRLINRINIQ